jgi:hypothetical protein
MELFEIPENLSTNLFKDLEPPVCDREKDTPFKENHDKIRQMFNEIHNFMQIYQWVPNINSNIIRLYKLYNQLEYTTIENMIIKKNDLEKLHRFIVRQSMYFDNSFQYYCGNSVESQINAAADLFDRIIDGVVLKEDDKNY